MSHGASAFVTHACSNELNVRVVNPLEDPSWEERLAGNPSATFFHGAAWVRVLQASYGFTPSFLIVDHDAGRRSLLPLMEIDSWLTGRRGVCLPFSDECPMLAGDRDVEARLLAALTTRAEARRWKSWELRGTACSLAPVSASATYLGHTLALAGDTSELFAKIHEPARRAIRRAQKSNLTVELSCAAGSLRWFHELLCKTRQRHGVPPQPIGFFENIQRYVLRAGKGCVVQARLGDVPVAGAVFFHHGNKALYKYGASDLRFQHLRPNNLVMWHGIEWHARAGFVELDFGRTDLSNEGLRRFKLGWGTTERLIQYYRYECRSRRFSSPAATQPGWRTALFKRLPPPVLRAIGAAAYRHIS